MTSLVPDGATAVVLWSACAPAAHLKLGDRRPQQQHQRHLRLPDPGRGGQRRYHSNPNSVNPPGATDTFTYIRDGDGDESTTTLINVADSKLMRRSIRT
jgi:hypothetical protein